MEKYLLQVTLTDKVSIDLIHVKIASYLNYMSTPTKPSPAEIQKFDISLFRS